MCGTWLAGLGLWTNAHSRSPHGSVTEVYDVPLRVRLACPEPWVDAATAALTAAGLVPDDHAAVGLSLAPGRQVLGAVDDWSVESLPHLVIGVRPHAIDVGPWVVPGVGPCARCVAGATFDDGRDARPGPLPAPLLAMASGWAARDVSAWVRGDTPSTWLCSWALDHAPLPRTRRWGRHPYCGCAWFELA